jgi:hypothetical protein
LIVPISRQYLKNNLMKIIKKRFQHTTCILLTLIITLISLVPLPLSAAQTTCTISAVSCAGGSITPTGSTTVNKGDNLTYTITPDHGKEIQEIRVDNAPVEIHSSYVFENIQENHRISVSFSPYELKIVDGASSLTLTPNTFGDLHEGEIFNDNNEAVWKGVPLYVLVNQVYQGDSTTYTVKAISSDPLNDITFTNSSEYPFLAPELKDQIIVANQYSTDNGITWGPIPPTSSGAGGWVWAPLRLIGPRQDGSGGSAFHHFGAGLIELELTNIPPWVTTQPGNKKVKSGSNVKFSVASNGNPAPAVYWQVSTNKGTNWSDLNGDNDTTLTLSSVKTKQNGYQYRAIFTNSAGVAISDAATLTVTSASSGGGGGGGSNPAPAPTPTPAPSQTPVITPTSEPEPVFSPTLTPSTEPTATSTTLTNTPDVSSTTSVEKTSTTTPTTTQDSTPSVTSVQTTPAATLPVEKSTSTGTWLLILLIIAAVVIILGLMLFFIKTKTAGKTGK